MRIAIDVLICSSVLVAFLFYSLKLLKKPRSRWLHKFLPIAVGVISIEAIVWKMSYHSSMQLIGEGQKQGATRSDSEHEQGGSRWDLMDCINHNQDTTRVRTCNYRCQDMVQMISVPHYHAPPSQGYLWYLDFSQVTSHPLSARSPPHGNLR